MRQATQDQAIIRGENNSLIGICLGYDYVAEHEFGIRSLRQSFGLPARTRQVVGADVHNISLIPTELRLMEFRKVSYLLFSRDLAESSIRLTGRVLNKSIRGYTGLGLTTAWAEDEFIIRLEPDREKLLRRMYQAFNERDVMIFLNGAKPFGGTGLMIVIRSAMSPDFLESMRVADLDYLDLTDAVAATGIVARLKSAGRHYFALSPKWADDRKQSVVFWLNPMEQDKHNFGWFTVADLDDWIAGRGKIPISRQPV